MEAQNNFWSTIGGLAEKVIDAKLRTQSAPQGAPSNSWFNPMFGDWGAYPQAEGKPQPGAFSFTVSALKPLLIVGGVILALILFAKAR